MLGRIVDQAVRPCNRRQHGRVLIRKNVEPTLVVKARSHELSAATRLLPVEICAHESRPQILDSSLLQKNERPRKQYEGHEARYRITRQPNERYVTHVPKCERLTGLHGDLPQIERALGLHRRLDMVLLAHRNTTGRDDQV